MDISCITKIRASPTLRNDFIAWFLEKSGLFSVKSVYKLATSDHNSAFAGEASSSTLNGVRSLWNIIWKSSVPQKMQIMAWKLCRDQVHGKDVPPVYVTVDFLDSYYRSIILAGGFSTEEIIKGKMSAMSDNSCVVHKTRPLVIPWYPPLPGTVALSVDGSFQCEDGSTAGMVLWNSMGQILFAAYQYIFRCNGPLEAEIHAIMQGMTLEVQHSSLPVVI
ncbi:Alpha-amylase [Hordeum vulgare]|nr:Alpha-amylase [Hordeum vulgare]